MALAMQKSYDSFCSEWADFKAILVKRKDENGWTLAKVVSWSPNASITGYAKELRTLPLNWGIAVLKKEGFFRYASSMTNGQNFRCFPLKIKIGLCVSWILFFFELWGFENLFACLGRKVDRRRRIRGLPKKASRITSTLDVEPSFFDVDAAILSPGKSGTSHGDGENPWVFARGILWCAGFLRWSLLQNDELFDWNLTDFNLWQLKHIETEVDTSVAGANYKRLHKSSPKRLRQIIPSEVFP